MFINNTAIWGMLTLALCTYHYAKQRAVFACNKNKKYKKMGVTTICSVKGKTMTLAQHEPWSNWSGSQHALTRIVQPKDLEDLYEIVRTEPKITVVGAGHSFSALTKTEQLLLNLDYLKGVAAYDRQHYQSTVYAGTRLYDLGEKLTTLDQALVNQGDIDQQSIAGAISTATHGTGLDFQCLSAYVQGFEMMLASGEIVQCDAQQHPDIFQAGRVGLGSLGIITKVQLQNRPMFRLKEQICLCPLAEIYTHIDQWKYQYQHIEFLTFIHNDKVILKTLDETFDDVQPRAENWLDTDLMLNLCSEITRSCPYLNPMLQKLLNVMIRPSTVVDWSSRMFPSMRTTKFNEMEYQLPLAQGLACFEEVLSTLRKHKVPMLFPLEFRYVKGDDIWLSPFYARDSVSISVHQFYKQDYLSIFNLVEPIFQKYGGRPHWGKIHTMQAEDLALLYPKWWDFLTLREQLDPQRKWLNPYLEQLFYSNASAIKV